jgi:hypothetical protein
MRLQVKEFEDIEKIKQEKRAMTGKKQRRRRNI